MRARGTHKGCTRTCSKPCWMRMPVEFGATYASTCEASIVSNGRAYFSMIDIRCLTKSSFWVRENLNKYDCLRTTHDQGRIDPLLGEASSHGQSTRRANGMYCYLPAGGANPNVGLWQLISAYLCKSESEGMQEDCRERQMINLRAPASIPDVYHPFRLSSHTNVV